MKKSFMILGATLLALAAVGCQNDAIDEGNTPVTPDEPIVEEPAEVVLHATLPESRTTLNADYSVEWKAGDILTVFQTVANETPAEWTNYKFTIVANENEEYDGTFKPDEGVVVPFENDVTYDWYVCSPYRSELKKPTGENREAGYFPIGTATQEGYNNSDHIASMDIMVGKAEGTRTPSVALKHLAVLHKFTVTNNSDQPTIITQLTIDGGTENYPFGTFWVDLTADAPTLDPTKANGKFTSRELKVTNGTELAVGESAEFYMLTAPFTLGVGETFTIKVKTTTGEQTFTKTATEAVEFKAGTYNTANLTYDYKIEYADHLYYETFNTTTSLTSVSKTNGDINVSRWNTYDKAGLTVYDGANGNIAYTNVSSATISRFSSSALVGMDDLYAYFGENGTITVEGIKLYGKTKLNLSFLQTYKSSGLKAEYSIDNGANWSEIDTYTNPTTATCEERSTNFEVAAADVIWLRFTATSSKPRIDNIKLTWQTAK